MKKRSFNLLGCHGDSKEHSSSQIWHDFLQKHFETVKNVKKKKEDKIIISFQNIFLIKIFRMVVLLGHHSLALLFLKERLKINTEKIIKK